MRRVRRRSVLRSAAGLGAVVVAGCNGGQPGQEDRQDGDDGNGDSGASTPTDEDPGADPAFHDKITAPDPQPEDHFGSAVAVTGETVFVGANRDDVERGTNAGSVHVFRRREGTWAHQTALTADDGARGDLFGSALAVSDTVALIGASQHDHSGESDAGAVYVFERGDESWTQQSKLVADDASRLDRFGTALALSGREGLVGAPFHAGNRGVDSGEAYLLDGTNGGWNVAGTLAPLAIDRADTFGTSVALSGDTALVGAPTDEHPNGSKAGALYHFDRTDGTWEHRSRIAPEDGTPGGRFGAAMDLSGDTLLVGAPHDVDEGLNDPGVAYVFVRSGNGWVQEARLVRSDANGDDGDDTDDRFGAAVTLAGDDVAVVGAPTDEDPNGRAGGSASVFERAGGSWRQVTKLSARHGRAEANYGQAMAAGADLAAVGVPRENLAEGRSAGATHLYTI